MLNNAIQKKFKKSSALKVPLKYRHQEHHTFKIFPDPFHLDITFPTGFSQGNTNSHRFSEIVLFGES